MRTIMKKKKKKKKKKSKSTTTLAQVRFMFHAYHLG